MRIGRVEPVSVEAPAQKPPESVRPPEQPSDQVALSRLSEKLIESSREARIEELREKVQAGTYEVPARELATRIIDSLLPAKED